MSSEPTDGLPLLPATTYNPNPSSTASTTSASASSSSSPPSSASTADSTAPDPPRRRVVINTSLRKARDERLRKEKEEKEKAKAETDQIIKDLKDNKGSSLQAKAMSDDPLPPSRRRQLTINTNQQSSYSSTHFASVSIRSLPSPPLVSTFVATGTPTEWATTVTSSSEPTRSSAPAAAASSGLSPPLASTGYTQTTTSKMPSSSSATAGVSWSSTGAAGTSSSSSSSPSNTRAAASSSTTAGASSSSTDFVLPYSREDREENRRRGLTGFGFPREEAHSVYESVDEQEIGPAAHEARLRANRIQSRDFALERERSASGANKDGARER
ncbi:hypothetical protein QBC44DRAFT_311236 [Cladorrhinum sp. PSN332]|nr:hypothetical protein QBC44DRAFT_311236 [Cladorrhinum sp. PSN332]